MAARRARARAASTIFVTVASTPLFVPSMRMANRGSSFLASAAKNPSGSPIAASAPVRPIASAAVGPGSSMKPMFFWLPSTSAKAL